MKTSIETLAIEGGKPIREFPLKPRVNIDDKYKDQIKNLLDNGVLSTWYGGPESRKFEELFANYFDKRYGVAVNSGTSALHVAYVAAGIGPGDEVIMPSVGYVSAASAAIQEGALPVICDVEPGTLGMDPSDLEKRITRRTKLIVPVHMWGIPGDIDGIIKVAQGHNIPILEDCGQSHGARFNGKKTGSFGEIASFSFAPRKHVCTGQGGMAIFKSEDAANKARSAANKGKGKGWHDYYRIGYSYAMTEMEAITGLDGLAKLDEEVEKRRMAAEIYREALKSTELGTLSVPENRYACYFKYPICLPEKYLPYKPFMLLALEAENISSRSSHPPMHTIPWLARHIQMNGKGIPEAMAERPVAERETARIIEVETGPGMTEEDVRHSAKGVVKVWNRILELSSLGILPNVTGTPKVS